MSDETETETPKRTRKPNPFTAFKKAQTAANRARRAAARADKLREEAQAAADKAATLKAELEVFEEAERVAWDALQAELADTGTDTDELAEEEGE